jgi:hypothetical protein
MSVEILWNWFGMTATAVGIMAGVWWALADFILDRVGPRPAEWGSRDPDAGTRAPFSTAQSS